MWIRFKEFFTNCKDLPQGTRDGPQFLCGSASLREEKINSSQSRQAAKKGELFLCAHLSEQVSLPCPLQQALREPKILNPPIQKSGNA